MIRPSICIAMGLLVGLSGTSSGQEPDDLQAQAEAMFASTFAEPCDWAFREDGSVRDTPMRWEFEETPEYGDPYTVTIFKFECNLGAYNTQQVYFVDGDYDGLRPVAFALPRVEPTFENDDDETALIDWELDGFYTRHIVVNSEFDPDSGTILEHSYWRGIGDASSTALWMRDGEEFVLKRYLYDPSYDGAVNPVTVIDYTKKK